MQTEIKEIDLSTKQEVLEKQRIFMTHSLDIQLGELYKNIEVRALVRNIDEITFTFFSIYTEIYHISLDKRIEGKPPL